MISNERVQEMHQQIEMQKQRIEALEAKYAGWMHDKERLIEAVELLNEQTEQYSKATDNRAYVTKEDFEETNKEIIHAMGLLELPNVFGGTLKSDHARMFPGQFIDSYTKIIVVESVLSALVIQHCAGDLCSSLVIPEPNWRPNKAESNYIECANLVLLSQTTQKGIKAAWRWWLENYKQAQRWPVLGGRDVFFMFWSGIDIRSWVKAGLLKDPCKSKQPEAAPTRLTNRSEVQTGDCVGSGPCYHLEGPGKCWQGLRELGRDGPGGHCSLSYNIDGEH